MGQSWGQVGPQMPPEQDHPAEPCRVILSRDQGDAKLGESASGSVDIRGFFGKKTTTKRKRKQAKPGEKRVGSNVVGVHVVDLTL